MKSAATEQLPGSLQGIAMQLIDLADKKNEQCAQNRSDCLWKVIHYPLTIPFQLSHSQNRYVVFRELIFCLGLARRTPIKS